MHFLNDSCLCQTFLSLIHLIILHYSNAKIWRLHHNHIIRTMTHIMGGQHPKATPAYTNYHGAAVSRYSHLAIAVLSFIRRGLASWSRGLAKSLLSFLPGEALFLAEFIKNVGSGCIASTNLGCARGFRIQFIE